MKKTIISLIMLIIPLLAKADAVEINGLYYYLSSDKASVAPGSYSGNIIIPGSFEYDSNLYTVIGIANGAFQNCSGITSVSIPTSVTTIGNFAFNNCSGLESITIPINVTSIGDQAFRNCDALTKVYISDIGKWCHITFGSSDANPLYHAKHIYNDLGIELTNIVIPDDVTKIEDYCFVNCSSINSIHISKNVTSIGKYAFYQCSSLSTVLIPNKVTTIGDWAFYRCTGLSSVTLPKSISSISTILSFAYCSNLKDVYCYVNSVPSIGYSTFEGTPTSGATLHVPSTSVNNYKDADYWKNFGTIETLSDENDYEVIYISSYNICTYSCASDLNFTNVTGLTAYTISDFNSAQGSLTLSSVNTVKAGEGLLLKGNSGEYVVPHTTTDATYTNYLVGVPTTTSVSPTDGAYTNFILANGSYGVNFYPLSTTGNIAGGKAYLKLPTASLSARMFSFTNGEPTAIENINVFETTESTIYDLQGRKVGHPTKGLYILNGKKVIIK